MAHFRIHRYHGVARGQFLKSQHEELENVRMFNNTENITTQLGNEHCNGYKITPEIIYKLTYKKNIHVHIFLS